MNLSPIKAYALTARREFIQAVSERAALFGITNTDLPEISFSGDVAMLNGKAVSRTVGQQCKKLCDKIQTSSFEQVMDQIAYSWFNRLMAIRYMELHDYLDHGYRVLSSRDAVDDQPEILRYAEQIDLPGLDRATVVELKLDGNKDAELFREVLLGQCHALQQAMPFLFESLEDETELLLPENLLHSDSLVRTLVDGIPEEEWDNIEIVGWLYQFYISEKKDQVIGKVVKSEDIPAATQLFTPNWIVKYMVQNSLGAQWMATYPQSPLKAQMEYYIEPAEQTSEVQQQLREITPTSLDPEALTLIDPASGSGHILVEAYELFKAIYLERGYRQRDVPQLILEKNLYGLDIDGRAAQLTGFALMMKGRADDRRLFERGVKLNVMALVDSTDFDAERLAQGVKLADYDLKIGDLTGIKALFEHATTFGSLIQVPEELAVKLPALKKLSAETSHDLFVAEDLKRLGPLVQQAELLAAQYGAVVANPPYMGGKAMNATVKKFAKENFPDAKADLFACFIERGNTLAIGSGHNSMVTMQAWMFLPTFQKMRERLIRENTIVAMAHLGARAFGSISGEVVQATAFVLRKEEPRSYKPVFFRLLDGNEESKRSSLLARERRFDKISQEIFRKIPGSPVAYWLSHEMQATFDNGTIVGDQAKVRKGLVTLDDNRFIKRWHEVSRIKMFVQAESSEMAINSGCKWFPINKGGFFRKWYGVHESVINWEFNGAELKAFIVEKYSGGSYTKEIRSEDLYFRDGITWNDITTNKIGFRYTPNGFLFSSVGPSAFFSDQSALLKTLGAANSFYTEKYADAVNPTIHFTSANFANMPLPAGERVTSSHVEECINTAKLDWDAYERSWNFQSLPLLTTSSESSITLESCYTAWITQNRDTITEMKRLEEENNRLFIDAYGLQDELTPDVPIEQITLTVNPAYRYGGKLTKEEQWTRFRVDTMEELISYVIGCMMGRYSLDAPGLIYAHSGNEGFDSSKYTTFPADDDGIIPLTDIEWFEDDATHRLIEFISVAWNESNLEDNLTFLADNLGSKKNETPRETIRRYFSSNFFKKHMQTYKKRPIYWLFSSGKQKAFQALVYLHRYNEGTLARMRTEYVVPLLGRIPRRIEDIGKEIDSAGSTAAQKRLEKQKATLGKQLDELRTFDEHLRHAADQRINIDLDDGVKVNYGKFGDLLAEVKKITGKK